MSRNSQLVVIFGHPGVGKTYIGNILEKRCGFYFYDGDANLSKGMKHAIKTKTPFTNMMRALFFQRLRKSVGLLAKQHPKLAIAQTFIKEKYRTKFLQEFPHARFMLITIDNLIREKRLTQRPDMPLDIVYARLMIENFEAPLLPHTAITNNTDGDEEILKQLQKIGIIK